MALEENVKEFGLTYFGMTDRRQGPCIMQQSSAIWNTNPSSGIVHVIGPEQGFTVRAKCTQFAILSSRRTSSSRESPVFAVIPTPRVRSTMLLVSLLF
jgi:hypothetical protein